MADSAAKDALFSLLAPHLCNGARKAAFAEVCDRTESELAASGGIGTLAEKTIHAVLKHFYAGAPEYEERRVLLSSGFAGEAGDADSSADGKAGGAGSSADGKSARKPRIPGFVADVARPEGVYEIQTRHFYTLKKKLAAFLAVTPVTIVYPVVHRKTLRWVDPTDGTIRAPRKTGKVDFGYRVLEELYGLGDLFPHEGLSVKLALLEVEEFKLLDGYGPDRKIRASRSDGFPQELVAEVDLRCPADYAYFLPATLPEVFTSADYASACKIPRARAQACVRVLTNLRVLSRVPSGGRGYSYRRAV